MIALLLLPALALELGAGVTPVQKVLQMMNDMKAKGEAEMKKEASAHSEYMSWCKSTSNTKEDAIREANALIGKLQARIQKADAEAARLTDEVADLDTQIATMAADKKASSELRAKESADFETVNADYTESIDAMGGALSTMQNVAAAKANPALIQTAVDGLPGKARMLVTAFMEEGQPGGAPAGNAYESSVGSVISMVEELQAKMSDERAALQKDEANAKHSYQMLQQELTMSSEASTDERDTKATRKAQRVRESAQDSGDLASTIATRDEDNKYLQELTALCRQKDVDFEARSELRGEELVALQQAIDIIADGAVSGAADKHLPALLQRKAFSLLRATSQSKVHEVEQMLMRSAQKLHSKALAAAAAQVGTMGHFDKIVGMIKDMITKLTEEASEEAEHKAWCDGELKSNKQTRDTKSSAIDQLTAQSEELSASIAKLGQDIADLTAAIAELDKSVQEATEQRQQEKADNTVAIADAKEAAKAVKAAIAVLKKFYDKAATATAFVQTKGPGDDAPASFDTPYTGMGGASGGVMGMLDVILSDFVRLDEETTAEEAEASRQFDAFSAESSKDRSAKASALDSAQKSKTSQEAALNSAQEDLARTQDELGSAEEYHAELKKACLEADVSYDERVAGREAEIASLQEALKALSTE